MSLSRRARPQLEWWVDNLMAAKNVMTRDAPMHTLTTDAPSKGWGAVYGNQSTGGFWFFHGKSHHINYFELLAVYLGLKAFCSSHCDIHISLRIDSTTVFAVINRVGTSHSEQLIALNDEIWEWCTARKLWISEGHIAGKCNVEADQAFRESQIATEWMLQKTLLSHALGELQFTPEIDLFASRINCQFPQYVTYRPDPEALTIDAFSVLWTGLKSGTGNSTTLI